MLCRHLLGVDQLRAIDQRIQRRAQLVTHGADEAVLRIARCQRLQCHFLHRTHDARRQQRQHDDQRHGIDEVRRPRQPVACRRRQQHQHDGGEQHRKDRALPMARHRSDSDGDARQKCVQRHQQDEGQGGLDADEQPSSSQRPSHPVIRRAERSGGAPAASTPPIAPTDLPRWERRGVRP
ncbi:hypothetical protein XOCgx_0791 [Xanthomonas oryzae pv. oryzicola]|nr:hypothetical protein XOCgx_0791 [Xanthomonas oryzae pv. oryzicola]